MPRAQHAVATEVADRCHLRHNLAEIVECALPVPAMAVLCLLYDQ